MSKVDCLDVAKWFIKQNSLDNSLDGNMKLQKLLFFAQLIYMAKNDGKTMFDNKFYAFEHGMVLEDIRLEYKKNYFDLYNQANMENITLPEDVEEAVILTKNIFGDSSAQELSELTHAFDAWNKYFNASKNYNNNWYAKRKSEIPYEELEKEIYRINKVLSAYEITSNMVDDEEEDY